MFLIKYKGMIYTNILYFIIAIAVFSIGPLSENVFSMPQNFISILLLLFLFWQFNKHTFKKLRVNYNKEIIDINQARKEYFHRVNINIIVSILFFIVGIFVFDFKKFLYMTPSLGISETYINFMGIGFFMLHLSFVWYWAFESMGKILQRGDSSKGFVWANIKFNLVIVIPWLILSLIIDLNNVINFPFSPEMMDSALSQVVLFGLFLLIFSVFAPVLITYLWDCKQFLETELKDSISNLCNSNRVKFKKIMSWNALNKGLITAGVIGLFPSFRYLLITPGLMKLLNRDEILAVVSHEVGHVKKKHLTYYLLFFVGFIVLSLGITDRLIKLFLNTEFGFNSIIRADGSLNTTLISFLMIFISIFMFIVYFRFIFGYFMRNFERQADLYCFQSGIDPVHMISAFKKLGSGTHENEKKSNWHHFNISERIDFIKKSISNPEMIIRHDKKVRNSLAIFIVIMIVFTFLSFNPYAGKLENKLDLNLMANVVESKIKKRAEKPELYKLLGMIYYEQGKWGESKRAFERSLQLNYNQPEALNDFAWLLLKCPDERFLNKKKALEFAKHALKLRKESYILDTLAEAYYENSMFNEAFIASKFALEIARKNRKYYKKQFEKMKKAHKLFKSVIKI